MDELYVTTGGSIKAAGDGKIQGYLVVFSGPDDPDMARDFFTKDTDFDVQDGDRTSLYYHHGKDPKIGKSKIGEGTLKIDEVGVWLDGQIAMRNRYEQAVYSLVEHDKAGLSSGTAPHLVEREPVGKSFHIKRWPLRLDASITPTPCERRASVAVALKALPEVPALEELMDETKAMGMMGRDVAWDQAAAEKRVREWADAQDAPNAKYARAFLYYSGDGTKFGDYKLQVADVQDGKLAYVPQAVIAAYGGHGVEQADIPEADKEKIRTEISALCAKMRKEFPDATFMPPWEKPEKKDAPAEVKDLALDAQIGLVQDAVAKLVNGDKSPNAPDWRWVNAYVFPDYVVYQKPDGKGYFRRNYLMDNGAVMLGDTETAVQQEWEPVKSADLAGLAESTLADHSQALAAANRDWVARMAALKALRETKAGRVLSQANRDRMSGMMDTMRQAMGTMQQCMQDMQGMMDDTMPKEQADMGSMKAAIAEIEQRYYLRQSELRRMAVA